MVGCGEGGGVSILGWSSGAQVDKRRTSGEIIEDVGWEPNIGCIEEDTGEKDDAIVWLVW